MISNVYCETMAHFIAPKSPDEYTWIFPTGCFDYCKSGENHPYLVGPMAYFSSYGYDIDGMPVIAGGDLVPDLPLFNLNGGLTLSLYNGFCSTTTDMLSLSEQDCSRCEEVQVKPTKFVSVDDGSGFIYYEVVDGSISNPYNFPITVYLSSPEGIFIPAAISLPPGTTYQFGANPIDFIPYNPILAGIHIDYEVTGNYGDGNTIICKDAIFIGMSQIEKLGGTEKSNISGGAAMTVVPNPVQSETAVFYTVENVTEFNGGTMEMYSMTGHKINSQKVHEGQGRISFDMNGLASGTYVVVFFSQGQRMGQQIIIKE